MSVSLSDYCSEMYRFLTLILLISVLDFLLNYFMLVTLYMYVSAVH